MVDRDIVSTDGASMLLHLGVVRHSWNLATSSHLCMQGFVTSCPQSTPDTESARASRKQYRDTLYSVLFDMNVPAVCSVDQVCILIFIFF
jgi:hypothetical protein